MEIDRDILMTQAEDDEADQVKKEPKAVRQTRDVKCGPDKPNPQKYLLQKGDKVKTKFNSAGEIRAILRNQGKAAESGLIAQLDLLKLQRLWDRVRGQPGSTVTREIANQSGLIVELTATSETGREFHMNLDIRIPECDAVMQEHLQAQR